MGKQDRNTDVTLYLRTGDTVTRKGLTDAEAEVLQDSVHTDPQLNGAVAIKRGKPR
jgi:hypothetical protein